MASREVIIQVRILSKLPQDDKRKSLSIGHQAGLLSDQRLLQRCVEVIGILLDPDEHTMVYVGDMFGEDRVIACHSKELPQKLGNILRAIRGV